MLLFSKRNKGFLDNRPLYPSSYVLDEDRRKRREQMVISRRNPLDQLPQLRSRLHKKTSLIIEGGEFIAPFLLRHDIGMDTFVLNSRAFKNLSLIELGYDISKIFKTNGGMSFNTEEYTDYYFFDLLEILFIFSKEGKRELFVQRIQEIFEEENSNYSIHDFMITKSGSGINSVVPILQDKTLQKLLKDYDEAQSHIDNARISAGILQRIFSGEDDKPTKTYSEEICEEVAKQWTDKENVVELKKLLSDTVKNAKSLVNQISQIRHTDKFSIPVEGTSLYRMISQQNMSIVELVILSLPARFVINQKATNLKNEYIKENDINETETEEFDSTIVDLENIPF